MRDYIRSAVLTIWHPQIWCCSAFSANRQIKMSQEMKLNIAFIQQSWIFLPSCCRKSMYCTCLVLLRKMGNRNRNKRGSESRVCCWLGWLLMSGTRLAGTIKCRLTPAFSPQSDLNGSEGKARPHRESYNIFSLTYSLHVVAKVEL